MSAAVYHYTDTVRLPWILQAAELQPGRNVLKSRPAPDLLWATAMPIPDKTAAGYSNESLTALRRGDTRTVRFTLRADDFAVWPQVVAGCPAWTPAMIEALEKSAGFRSTPRAWRGRIYPLPRSAWLSVETRSIADPTWVPLDPDAELIDLSIEGGPALGVQIGDYAYMSGKVPMPSGVAAYSPFVLSRRAAA